MHERCAVDVSNLRAGFKGDSFEKFLSQINTKYIDNERLFQLSGEINFTDGSYSELIFNNEKNEHEFILHELIDIISSNDNIEAKPSYIGVETKKETKVKSCFIIKDKTGFNSFIDLDYVCAVSDIKRSSSRAFEFCFDVHLKGGNVFVAEIGADEIAGIHD